jgi:hypothetical protein
MDILGDRRYIEVPGDKTHELPPLLVRMAADVRRLDRVMGLANDIVDEEDIIPSHVLDDLASDTEVERRRMDLAVNLVEQYLGLIRHWQWGNSILDWIRQCEITFGSHAALRNLLRADVWPHAGRASFVTLLGDKGVGHSDVTIQKAVGLRLTFRQPPPIGLFSDQFLFYLNGTVATSAYQSWASKSPEPTSSLPPERFTFQVVNMSLD